MVYQILISTRYLNFSDYFLAFMIVGLVGQAVVIAEDFRPLILLLFLSPDNTSAGRCPLGLGRVSLESASRDGLNGLLPTASGYALSESARYSTLNRV